MPEALPSIQYQSPKEHYTADACVAWCFDARFSGAYDAFLAARGFRPDKIDLVKAAGGAQAFALDGGADREVALSQIAKSIKLHHTNRVALMVHMDCGAYGGSKAFDDDHQKEWDHHVAELSKAKTFIQQNFPEITTIESWIADFDGVHAV
jgi:hypothetical protein